MEKRFEDSINRARSEVSRLAKIEKEEDETVNVLDFAELAEKISKASAGNLRYLDLEVGEILSDSRGQGSFQQMGILAQEE